MALNFFKKNCSDGSQECIGNIVGNNRLTTIDYKTTWAPTFACQECHTLWSNASGVKFFDLSIPVVLLLGSLPARQAENERAEKREIKKPAWQGNPPPQPIADKPDPLKVSTLSCKMAWWRSPSFILVSRILAQKGSRSTLHWRDVQKVWKVPNISKHIIQ